MIRVSLLMFVFLMMAAAWSPVCAADRKPGSRKAGEPAIRKVSENAAARSGATTQSADDKTDGETANGDGDSDDAAKTNGDAAKANDDAAKTNDDAAKTNDDAAKADDADAPPQATGKADPTQPSDALKDVLTSPRGGGAATPGAAAQPKLPAILLRARVLVKDRPAAALIQVGESLHRVHAGADMTVSTAAGAVQLRVEQLDADGVRIALPQFDQTLVLR